MKTGYLFILILPFQLSAQPFTKSEITRWEQQAKKVTIIRDTWGIPHIYGKTDADAVFGLMYAQCEDDFRRVEMNYIEKLGRMAEIKGDSFLYDDLLNRLVLDSAAAVTDFKKSPAWLVKLMNSFADGINYFLYKNPQVKPSLLHRFKPWYPLLWTDGSIGAINTAGATRKELEELYGGGNKSISSIAPIYEEDLSGSNGFAFSPSITASGNAILYINPHVTFYFRPEVHMVSEEGLNVYGAVTWGQFFVYQGFNENCGWMHTSSDVDAGDLYIEKITKKGNGIFYDYNKALKPVSQKKITLKYKTETGTQKKTFNALYTHHGPVMAKRDDQWLSLRADNRLLNGLIQCWQRTKSKSLSDFKKTLDLRGNISNNTVYADAEGNIAYWHGNRVPLRDKKFDWSQPVDGSIVSTEWKGYHSVDQTVHIINPSNGWLQNCNSTPFTAAGKNSPAKQDYPDYMAPDEENFRGLNAVRVLSNGKAYTIDKVIEAGYDNFLTAFEILIPSVVSAFEKITSSDTLYQQLYEPVQVLKQWDYRCDENSTATTLAVEWGQRVLSRINRIRDDNKDLDFIEKSKLFSDTASQQYKLEKLSEAVRKLIGNHNSWKVPWGDINRYQRLTGDIDQVHDDTKPSLPVGYAVSTWGCLPSFASRYYKDSRKRYGYGGNSFICAVEFPRKDKNGKFLPGQRLKAKSLLAGGDSGDPTSKHFGDQALMYTKGQFKEVLFYKEDVIKQMEREYRPGE